MNLIPTKTPLIAKKLFPNYVWDIASSKKELYLTFDDGPTPEVTTWTLDILKQYNIQATFFCIGSNIKKHPKIFERIILEGHSIGNHTQHHIKGWKTKTEAYLQDIVEAQQQIDNSICAFQQSFQDEKKSDLNNSDSLTNYFRPPYGQIRPEQGKELIALGYHIIMWDVLSFDWEVKVSPEQCLNNVISKSKAGSIIVFHDSVKASKNMMFALPKVIEKFRNDGYEFKALNL